MNNDKMPFNKKSNLVLQFIILIIIAAIMIFVVTAFSMKIFEAIFPSSDKATIKSFDILYTTLDLKSKDLRNYDSTMMTIYLYDDYQVILFKPGSGVVCAAKTYNRPSDCTDTNKNCLCLYNDLPDSADKNKNIEKCYTFANDFKISAFELSNNSADQCLKPGNQQFHSIIIVAKSDGTNHEIFVWLNTEENRKKDADLNKKMCPTKTNDVCSGNADGEGVYGVSLSDKINTQCKLTNPNSKAWSGICSYSETTKQCTLNCIEDVYCSMRTRCEDYYSIDGNTVSNTFDYMIKGYMSEDYCANDHCGFGGGNKCTVQDFGHLVCKNSASGEASKDSNDPCYFPNCGTFYMERPLENYVQNYDASKCTPEQIVKITRNFQYVDGVYFSERTGLVDMCDFVQAQLEGTMKSTNTNLGGTTISGVGECTFKYKESGQKKYIMYYDTANIKCKTGVDACFNHIYYCQSPYYNYEVSDPRIKTNVITPIGGTVKASDLCKEVDNSATLGKDYDCLINKDIPLQLDIKNTGKYDLHADLFYNLPSSLFLSTPGPITPVANGQSNILNANIKQTAVTTYYIQLNLGAECTDAICKNDLSLKSKILSDEINGINIMFVKTLS
jgi:hypothetical protein